MVGWTIGMPTDLESTVSLCSIIIPNDTAMIPCRTAHNHISKNNLRYSARRTMSRNTTSDPHNNEILDSLKSYTHPRGQIRGRICAHSWLYSHDDTSRSYSSSRIDI